MATRLFDTLSAKQAPAFGMWLALPGSFHARTVAQATPHASFILIDCEHGLVPLHNGAAETINAVASTKNAPSCLVRIPATGATTSTSWQIKYALDAGAQGIMVPMISTPEKAKEVVADAKFPPVGRRGFGSPFTQDVWQLSALDYLNSANEKTLILVQIETKEAVQNAKAIAEVDGIGEAP
jgi:4-hydroxy-2-oxoheptanedioate aldolase